MQPSDSVHHETIRLVSLSFRLRNKMAAVVSTDKLLARISAHASEADNPVCLMQGEAISRSPQRRTRDRRSLLLRNVRTRGLFPDADQEY